MKPLIVAFCIFLSAAPLCGQEKSGQLPEFTSAGAIKAVELYDEKLAFLDARLVELVEDAQAALHADLQKALQAAVIEGDFPEVQRLSEFLQGSHAKVPKENKNAAPSDGADPATAGDPNAAIRLGDPAEVRKRSELQLTAVKVQAIADFEKIARTAVAEGQLDRAAEIWEEVISLDPDHQEAGKFFSRVKRKDAPVAADDNRNVWQSDAEPNSGYLKTRTGWVRLTQGKPEPELKEVGRTEHTIILQSGNNVYRLHRDALYGKHTSKSTWYFHGHGRWLR